MFLVASFKLKPQINFILRAKYEVKLKELNEMSADAVLGSAIIEHKSGVSDLRVLNATFIALAKIIEKKKDHTAILLLDEPRMSLNTLVREWETLHLLFRPEIYDRLSLIVFSDGELAKVLGNPSQEEIEAIPMVWEQLSAKQIKSRRRKPDSFFEVFKVLLIHWFRKEGPIAVGKLGEFCGFSYPTIASSLNKLEDSLVRHSNRSVELRKFPREAWYKLVAASDDVRRPHAFRARNPRSIGMLLERLMERQDEAVAIGGVIGAKHYLPGLDLVGLPRLDLTVHDWSSSQISQLVKRLDPGLKPAGLKEAPQVVVHNLYRERKLYENDGQYPIADEVECLLDLHEARLEQQAQELLDGLKKKALA